MIELRRYQRPNGKVPLTEWLAELRDPRAKAKLQVRLRGLSVGITGDAKSVGEGVYELRERTGPGYRLYYGRHGMSLVVLLCAGDKGTQRADIKRAKQYWNDWKRRNS